MWQAVFNPAWCCKSGGDLRRSPLVQGGLEIPVSAAHGDVRYLQGTRHILERITKNLQMESLTTAQVRF